MPPARRCRTTGARVEGRTGVASRLVGSVPRIPSADSLTPSQAFVSAGAAGDDRGNGRGLTPGCPCA
jgi:hypothetical protein